MGSSTPPPPPVNSSPGSRDKTSAFRPLRACDRVGSSRYVHLIYEGSRCLEADLSLHHNGQGREFRVPEHKVGLSDVSVPLFRMREARTSSRNLERRL